MATSRTLRNSSRYWLESIAKFTNNPAIYDWLYPRGSVPRLESWQARAFGASQATSTGLHPFGLGTAVAAEWLRTAWAVERASGKLSAVFADLDDWCPTVPRKLHLPPWWPPLPEPDDRLLASIPDARLLAEFHTGFAAQLVHAEQQLEGSPLGKLLTQAIDRSLSAIDSLQNADLPKTKAKG